MPTAKTKTFMSGNSEAVRLPKGIGFGPNVALDVIREGDVITLKPQKVSVSAAIEQLRKMPVVPVREVRDPDIFPEREGL
jgi:antitoxin VapB